MEEERKGRKGGEEGMGREERKEAGKDGGWKAGMMDFYKALDSGSSPCPKCSLYKVVLAYTSLFRFRIENILCHKPDLKSPSSTLSLKQEK